MGFLNIWSEEVIFDEVKEIRSAYPYLGKQSHISVQRHESRDDFSDCLLQLLDVAFWASRGSVDHEHTGKGTLPFGDWNPHVAKRYMDYPYGLGNREASCVVYGGKEFKGECEGNGEFAFKIHDSFWISPEKKI